MTHQLMTSQEVAAWFGVHQHTIQRWVKEGRLPAVRLPSGRLRFRVKDVAAAAEWQPEAAADDPA